jgi:hypothetical protein
MADKIVRARVTQPTFINGVLHLPGEDASANLTELGVDKLGDKTPGLEAQHEGPRGRRCHADRGGCSPCSRCSEPAGHCARNGSCPARDG